MRRVKRAADEGRLKLFDVGVAVNADSLWFNLKPGAFAGDPRAAWIQRDELRQAISLAVDRKVFVDTVYLGAAVPVFGPITPGNKAWYAADAAAAGARPGEGAGAARVDRPHRSQRRRRGSKTRPTGRRASRC